MANGVLDDCRIAVAAAETQEQALLHMGHRQHKSAKTSPGRPKQAQSGYSQGNPEASRALALKAQQKVQELSQRLGSETQVSVLAGSLWDEPSCHACAEDIDTACSKLVRVGTDCL